MSNSENVNHALSNDELVDKELIKRIIEIQDLSEQNFKRKIDCLRCNIPMEKSGNFKFLEGARTGLFGNIFELLQNRESFDLYHCPECGKVEFFIPEK